MAQDYDDDIGATPLWSTWRVIAVAIACVLMVILINAAVRPVGSFHIPHIKADLYIWPEGCRKIDYESSELGDISPSCANAGYYLGNGAKWGWVDYHGLYSKLHNWYRIDNDAVAIGCDSVKPHCGILDVHKNIFYQKNP